MGELSGEGSMGELLHDDASDHHVGHTLVDVGGGEEDELAEREEDGRQQLEQPR